jgi:hypothetical protein
VDQQLPAGAEYSLLLPATFAHPQSRCNPYSFRPPLLHSPCTFAPASVAWSCREGQCPRDGSDLSCSLVARSTKDTSDGFIGHAVLGGNLAQGLVVFNDAAYHVWPFFRRDAMVRLTWTRMLV